MRQDPAYFVELRPEEEATGQEDDTGGRGRTVSPRDVRPEAPQREDREREEPLSARRVSEGPLADKKEPFEAETAKGREVEAIPLPGDPSSPSPSEVLAEALASAKERWAEVNQEALEPSIRTGQGEAVWTEGFEGMEEASSQPLEDASQEAAPAEGANITETGRTTSPAEVGFSSDGLGPTAPSGEISQGVETAGGLQRQLTSRFESLAASLSNPHQTQPMIDLFV